MKKILLFISMVIQIIPIFSYAGNYTLTNYVTDYTNNLTTEQINTLNEQASGFQAQTTNEIAIVFIPNRDGRELYDITLEIFRNNGIGSKEHDNGALLVVATEEKKLRIMVGYGLEGALPDVYLSSLLENKLRPLLNSGNYYELARTYQQEIIGAIQNESFSSPGNEPDGSQFVIGFMLGYWLLTILSQAFRTNPLEKLFKDPASYLSIPLLLAGGWASISFGILLGFIGLCIGSLLGSLYRSGGGRSFGNGYYGGGFGGGGFGGGGFGGFGGGSSGGGGAGD